MSHSDEKPWPLSSTHLKTEYLGIRMIKIRVEGQRTWADPTNSQNHHLQITIVYCNTAIEASQTYSQRIGYTVLNFVQKMELKYLFVTLWTPGKIFCFAVTVFGLFCAALQRFDDGKLLRENPAGGLTTATEHHDSAKKSEKGQNGKLQGHRYA